MFKRKNQKSTEKKLIKLLFASLIFSLTAAMLLPAGVSAENSGNSAPFVIMLDPGHGGNDPGATRSEGDATYKEQVYNDQITKACYDRLIQYDNVLVYRSRVANNHISTYARAAYAKDVGANLFIAFHINSSSYKSAHGACTIIPSGHYRPELKKETSFLSEKILKNLTEVGLKNNGFNVRNLEDSAYLNYPDGSTGDYYEVIRMGVRNGIPSLILEVAFITSDVDLAILNDGEKIKQIGTLVADAIADYYGLKLTGNTLVQPVQTAQTSGVTLGTVPKTLNIGDVYPLTASGGSGEGDYSFLTSNPLIARIEGNNLIVVGSGQFRVTVTKLQGNTTTPRSAGNTNVTVSARSTSVTGEVGDLSYSASDGLYKTKLSVRLKDQVEKAVPQGTVKLTGAGPEELTASFDSNGNCVFDLSFAEAGKYELVLSYTSSEFDGYKVGAPASVSVDIDPQLSVTPSPEPTSEPTEAPTQTPDVTEEPVPTFDATEDPGLIPAHGTPENSEASVSFGTIEILTCLLIVSVIIVIVLIVKLAGKKKKGKRS